MWVHTNFVLFSLSDTFQGPSGEQSTSHNVFTTLSIESGKIGLTAIQSLFLTSSSRDSCSNGLKALGLLSSLRV